jgi:hypothetical protein
MKNTAVSLCTALLLTVAFQARAQDPTELYDCVGDVDSEHFCSDSTAVLVDSGCGAIFNRYYGRIAWPVLRYVGPVTISVLTRVLADPPFPTPLPLYVEVRGRSDPGDSRECRTGLGGHVTLVARGGPECGGTWESVGPLDLRQYGVHLGDYYSVQAVFFQTIPDDFGRIFSTVGFSCIRVISHPSTVASLQWGRVKALFRD